MITTNNTLIVTRRMDIDFSCAKYESETEYELLFPIRSIQFKIWYSIEIF